MEKVKKEKLDIILNTALISDLTPYMASIKCGTGVLIQTALPAAS